MSPPLLPALLLSAAVTAAPVDLGTLAAASERPAACGGWPSSRGRHGTWERVRRAADRDTCADLARGHSLLALDPAGALELARGLGRRGSAWAPPEVLAARALVRLGRHAEAWERFETARALEPTAASSPGALRDLASAAARTGRVEAAGAALQALLPRAALLATPAEATRVHVEAATLAMLRGPDGLGEAISYLSAVRPARTAPELAEIVVATLALALDRAGRVEEASAALGGTSGPWRLLALVDPDEPAARRFELPYFPDGEVHAVIAMLAERVDRELAAVHWRRFLEERRAGAFVEHAERHLARSR